MNLEVVLLRVFRDLKKAKADPDISIFNMCMTIFAKSYSMKEAENLWEDIKRTLRLTNIKRIRYCV